MKPLLLSTALVFSSFASANNSSTPVSIPYIPCYMDGEYIGTIEINQCSAKNGTWVISQKSQMMDKKAN